MTKITKEGIIGIAAELFAARGFHGTSIQDIAQSVGLQKGSIYSHFAGKEDIAVAALKQTLDHWMEACQISGDWKTDFEQAIRSFADLLKQRGRCIGLQFLYDLDAETDGIHVASFFKTIKNTLKQLLHDGLPDADIEPFVEDILALIEGATLWTIINKETIALDRAVEAIVNKLDRMICETVLSDYNGQTEIIKLYKRVTGHNAPESIAEFKLAQQLAKAEADIIALRGALAGQIEAESCFR